MYIFESFLFQESFLDNTSKKKSWRVRKKISCKAKMLNNILLAHKNADSTGRAINNAKFQRVYYFISVYVPTFVRSVPFCFFATT